MTSSSPLFWHQTIITHPALSATLRLVIPPSIPAPSKAGRTENEGMGCIREADVCRGLILSISRLDGHYTSDLTVPPKLPNSQSTSPVFVHFFLSIFWVSAFSSFLRLRRLLILL